MARTDEIVVEEWLNRKGYFTIRGAKKGQNEIDLLAFRPTDRDMLHVEVNVSIAPLGWIGKKTLMGKDLPAGNTRSPEQIKEGIAHYVKRKYESDNVSALRDLLCPASNGWRFMYVYGNLNHPEELDHLETAGVETRGMLSVLKELRNNTDLLLTIDSDAAHFVDLWKLT